MESDFEEDQSKKFQDIDFESLQTFKATLFCSFCSKFPRPDTSIFTCPKCCCVVCANCRNTKNTCKKCKESMKPVSLILDSNLTKV